MIPRFHHLAACLSALSASAAIPAAAQPNLMASINPQTGVLSLQNTGTALAQDVVVGLHCSGACPDPAGIVPAGYLNPALPNRVSIAFPMAAPGLTHVHALPFWSQLQFPAGSLTFTTCADALRQVAESNEGDNCTQAPMRNKGPKARFKSGNGKLKLAE